MHTEYTAPCIAVLAVVHYLYSLHIDCSSINYGHADDLKISQMSRGIRVRFVRCIPDVILLQGEGTALHCNAKLVDLSHQRLTNAQLCCMAHLLRVKLIEEI